jgi:transcriptional regulator with XRE-family HTH domain
MPSKTNDSIHHPLPIGKRIAKLRALRGMKQSTLANAMGISHQAISRLEQSDTIDDEKLKEVADALGVSVDAIMNFNDEISAFTIQNMNDNSQAIYQYNFNPIDKIVELYDRLLQSEREKINILESMLNKGKK